MTIYTVSSSMAGAYLPVNDDPYCVHSDSDGAALDITRALADEMIRDGEHSAEVSDEEEGAGDWGMVELLREGKELFREILSGVEKAIQTNTGYSYLADWSQNPFTMEYFAGPSSDDNPKCSDDTCEECYPYVEEYKKTRATGEAPTLTVQLVRGLVDDGRPNAVLYLNTEVEPPRLDIWVQEHAWNVVLTLEQVLNTIADAPAEPISDEEIEMYLLEDTQAKIDEIFAEWQS